MYGGIMWQPGYPQCCNGNKNRKSCSADGGKIGVSIPLLDWALHIFLNKALAILCL